MDAFLDDLSTAAPRFWDGLVVTLQLGLGGAVVAFVIAVLLGLLTLSPSAWLRAPARAVVEFFRGTSLVVQLFFFFYVLPQMGLDFDPIPVGIMALGLNYGAYGAEVVRGSLAAVPKAQWEATTALSMGSVQRMVRIIWPQGWALMLPGLNNLLVMLVKGTALASFITLQDVTFVADDLVRTMGKLFSFGCAFAIYYAVNSLLSSGMRVLEMRAQRRLGLKPESRKAVKRAEAIAGVG
ncbi:ectoine/hydroxyectoine ABC transporter permease subunit EhuC [Ruania alkalisoli]|uniref:Ectoine/hydroxyectoine ABC transporter permease subunit EhuC n=1 Tax=Ruania alkalisoli TaxID=2779775 RepID=A0A7M1SXV9_9MICO|nr:ectoine/hydroxyectoine ABC transporter permease subunit EhuC [Ruania alkalisoli]QOR71867.1 ectoine/hydroxyectoine ABC transporter permease subunit EhuC [Ruania alkalisoli]